MNVLYDKPFLLTFPGAYYYTTRYVDGWRRAFHLLKYWMLYLLVAWMVSSSGWSHRFAYFISWAGFLNLYDWFCYQNDGAAGRELHPNIRVQTWRSTQALFLYSKMGWQAALLLLLLACSPNGLYVGFVVACYVMLSIVFETHNHLNETARPITLYLLYVLKGACCWVGFYPLLWGSSGWTFSLFTLFFSAAYVPRYICKKRGIVLKGRKGTVLRWLCLPFLIKNLIMLALVFWRPHVFLLVWGWMVFVTLLEACVWRYRTGCMIQAIEA